jgi:hypothetical protein
MTTSGKRRATMKAEAQTYVPGGLPTMLTMGRVEKAREACKECLEMINTALTTGDPAAYLARIRTFILANLQALLNTPGDSKTSTQHEAQAFLREQIRSWCFGVRTGKPHVYGPMGHQFANVVVDTINSDGTETCTVSSMLQLELLLSPAPAQASAEAQPAASGQTTAPPVAQAPAPPLHGSPPAKRTPAQASAQAQAQPAASGQTTAPPAAQAPAPLLHGSPPAKRTPAQASAQAQPTSSGQTTAPPVAQAPAAGMDREGGEACEEQLPRQPLSRGHIASRHPHLTATARREQDAQPKPKRRKQDAPSPARSPPHRASFAPPPRGHSIHQQPNATPRAAPGPPESPTPPRAEPEVDNATTQDLARRAFPPKQHRPPPGRCSQCGGRASTV